MPRNPTRGPINLITVLNVIVSWWLFPPVPLLKTARYLPMPWGNFSIQQLAQSPFDFMQEINTDVKELDHNDVAESLKRYLPLNRDDPLPTCGIVLVI